jgi:peptidoglycan/LPS O-acetylase OafA/YrhL
MNDDGPRSTIDRVYLPRIDTLRALAALDVVYIHYFSMMVPVSIRFVPDGVQLFFVLSGFLIAQT